MCLGGSRQPAHRYQSLANVPAAQFEEALSGPDKPTTAAIDFSTCSRLRCRRSIPFASRLPRSCARLSLSRKWSLSPFNRSRSESFGCAVIRRSFCRGSLEVRGRQFQHALMCNLYSMTATVDELRRMFGPFEGDTTNLPSFGELVPSSERIANGGRSVANPSRLSSGTCVRVSASRSSSRPAFGR